MPLWFWVGEHKFGAHSPFFDDIKIDSFTEYKRLEIVSGDNDSTVSSGEVILYKGKITLKILESYEIKNKNQFQVCPGFS